MSAEPEQTGEKAKTGDFVALDYPLRLPVVVCKSCDMQFVLLWVSQPTEDGRHDWMYQSGSPGHPLYCPYCGKDVAQSPR